VKAKEKKRGWREGTDASRPIGRTLWGGVNPPEKECPGPSCNRVFQLPCPATKVSRVGFHLRRMLIVFSQQPPSVDGPPLHRRFKAGRAETTGPAPRKIFPDTEKKHRCWGGGPGSPAPAEGVEERDSRKSYSSVQKETTTQPQLNSKNRISPC